MSEYQQPVVLDVHLDEVEGLIARFEKLHATWRGNPGYQRSLDIELMALRMLRHSLMVVTLR